MRAAGALKSKALRFRAAPIAVSLAALAAGATFAVLPPTVFRAMSVVAVDEPSAGLRSVAARGAATFAVSKPVMTRAATSLNGTDLSAPAPGFAERLFVTVGLSSAKGGASRLADALAASVKARASEGVVEIEGEADDPTRAARIAGAMADALVVEEDLATSTAARRTEAAAATRLDALRATSRDAHQRLAALGGSEADPVLALAGAANATRAAEAHLAAVRAVIAAGNPPLGAGAELPQSAASLQQTYWDLKKQLDKAAETMGERHTTVIALRDGVSRAASSLTAEWRRIERTAESDVTAARSREATLRKAGATLDPAKRTAIDEARRAAGAADAAVSRASVAATPAAAVPMPFRVVAQAAAPASMVGLPFWQRAVAAAAVAAAVLGAALLGRRRFAGMNDQTAKPSKSAARPAQAARSEPVVSVPQARVREAVDYDFFAQAPKQAEPYEEPRHRDERSAAMPFEAQSFDHVPDADARSAQDRIHPELRDSLRAVAAELGASRVRDGMATMMVASNIAGADTGTVALALGEASAELGYRVLVIECEHAGAGLAEAVEPRGEPILVDAFGALRAALPAERTDDLFLAPALRDGARIAGALARNTHTVLVDDLAAAFDVVVIDGGRASDAVAAGWSGDSYIRVGRFASRRDDDHFLALFDAPAETLLGTVAAGRFVMQEIPVSEPETGAQRAPERPAGRPALRAVAGGRDDTAPRHPAKAPAPAAPRRRIAGR